MKQTHSFTLIELLVVIAIIGILAGIIILSLGDNTNLAREAKAKAELSQITKTLLIYKTGNSVYPIDDCDLSEAGSCSTLRSAIPNLPITEESVTYESDGLAFTTRATLTTAEYETTSSNPQVLQVGGGAPAIPTAEAAADSSNPDDGDTVNLSSTLANGTATAWSWDCGSGVIATTANTSFNTTGLGGTTVACTVTINDTYTDSVNINVVESEYVNLAEVSNGGILEYASHTYIPTHTYSANHIVDGITNSDIYLWAYQCGGGPADFIVSFEDGKTLLIDKLLIYNEDESYVTGWYSKNFEVYVTTDSDYNSASWNLVKSGTLAQVQTAQEFLIDDVQAKYIKLRILNIWGSEWWELQEFQVWGYK